MVPQVAPLQPAPERLQETAVFVVPVTVAVNCRCAPVTTFAVVGETETATGGATVTVAEADLVTSACEVAVTVTVAGLGTALGAVYKPPVVTVPQAAPLQPVPETLHVTAVSVLPLTVAENCCWVPVTSCTLVGETLMVTEVLIDTVAVPNCVASATEIAFTVTTLGIGGVAGAVYKPAAVICPQVMPAQPGPERFQLTTEFVVPVTCAVNCCCAPGFKSTDPGDTVTEIAACAIAGITTANAKRQIRIKRGRVFVRGVRANFILAAWVPTGPDSLLTLGLERGQQSIAEPGCLQFIQHTYIHWISPPLCPESCAHYFRAR